MDKKTLTIILALALIVSFFLPLFSYGGIGLSAYKIVFGAGSSAGSAVRFLWLLIPIIGIVVLFGRLGRGLSSNSDSVSWIPLAVIVFFIVRTFIVVKTAGGAHYSLSEYIKTLGIGFWIALVASVLLAFYRPSRY